MLSKAEVERLAILAEECAEVTKVCGKILRHGYHAEHKGKKYNNRAELELELGHVKAITEMLQSNMDVLGSEVNVSYVNKLHDYMDKKFTHHQ